MRLVRERGEVSRRGSRLRSCETAVITHGGMGYAKEYHVERYFREMLIRASRRSAAR
jgi:hypothetical protein